MFSFVFQTQPNMYWIMTDSVSFVFTKWIFTNGMKHSCSELDAVKQTSLTSVGNMWPSVLGFFMFLIKICIHDLFNSISLKLAFLLFSCLLSVTYINYSSIVCGSQCVQWFLFANEHSVIIHYLLFITIKCTVIEGRMYMHLNRDRKTPPCLDN